MLEQLTIYQTTLTASQLNYSIAGMVLVALAATVALLITMYHHLISKRLHQVAKALQQIADGDEDLSQRLNENPKDEIGAIAS